MSQITIRFAETNDAEAMLQVQRDVLAEGQFLMTTLDDFNQTVEGQKRWIQTKLANERETLIIAEVDGFLAGWLVFQSPDRKRLAHTGSFRMMVAKENRSRGVGKRLLTELLTWARQNPLIEKVGLGVFSTNTAAISLYKKMGFVEEGRKVKEVKMSHANYIDDVLMYQLVK